VPCSWPVPPLVVWFWVPLLCGLCAALPRLLAPVTLLLCSGLLWGSPRGLFVFLGVRVVRVLLFWATKERIFV
jgi:hypothetical protein